MLGSVKGPFMNSYSQFCLLPGNALQFGTCSGDPPDDCGADGTRNDG